MDIDAKVNNVLKATCHDAGLGLVQMTDIDGTLFKMSRESKNNGVNLESVTEISKSLTPLEAYYLGMGVGAAIQKEIEYMESRRNQMPMEAASLAEILNSLKG
jgi:hypothetical protein